MKYRLAWGLLFVAACGEVQSLRDGPQTLTVSVMGDGAVTSTPAGIDCGATCTADFAANSSVTLTATPAAGSAFVGWSGDCSGSGPCTLTMDGAKTAMASFAVHGARRWVGHVSFAGQDTIDKVVVDVDGNVVAAGMVSDGPDFDLFVIKYAKEDGHVLWMQRLDTNSAFSGGLATDADGNVYIAARLLGATPVMIGTTTVMGDFVGNIIVVRLAAATGAPVWAKQWGGDGQDEPFAVAVSGADVYVVGTTSSTNPQFDSKTFTSSSRSAFIVRAGTASGTAVEAKLIPANIRPFGVAVNGTHIAVVGQVTQAITIDNRCTLSPSGSGSADPEAMILDLLGATLACQWGKNFGDFAAGNDASFHSVAAFPGGGWVAIGDFKGNILLAGSGASLTSRGSYDVVAGRFAGDGAHVWSFRYGDTGFDLGYGVSVTPEGNVLLAGTFNTSITFGLVTLMGTMNSFVTRMSTGTTPTHEWAVGLGGDNYDLTEAVATSSDGFVYVASIFNGMTNVAGTALTAQDQDSWIAALVR